MLLHATLLLSAGMTTLLGADGGTSSGAPYAFLDLPRNSAENAAEGRPPFSMADPVGPAFTDAQKEAQREAGRALLERLRGAHERLDIPPGDYRFPGRQPLRVAGLRDVVIEAEGVTFWMERPAEETTAECWGWRFEDCHNVTIRGLTLDYDPLLFTQGRIERLDYETGVIDLSVDDGFPVVAYRPLQIVFFRPNGDFIPQPPHFHAGAEVAGPRALRVAMKTMDQVRAQSEDPKILEAFEGRSRIGVGDYAVLPFRTGTALQIERCSGMTFEDVTLYAAPGFAFLESGGGGGHVYRRCRVIRRPGTRRLWASNADAFHSRMLEKGSTLEACEFAHTGDDFLNFHSFWHLVTHRFAPDRFVLFPHMYEPFRVGQTISFFDRVSAAPQGQAAITRLEPLEDAALLEKTRQAPEAYGFIPYHGTPLVVTLDREVSAGEGSLVDAHSLNSPGIVVKDCYFHDAMGRGALVGGAKDIAFENNTWRDCNGGVQVFSCLWFYVEGPFPERVVVRGNRFLNADAMPAPVQPYQPVNGTICMTLVASGGNYAREVVVNGAIVVTGNTIYRARNYPILVAYADGVEIADNHIIEPMRYVSRMGYDTTPPYYKDAEGNSNPRCAILVTRSNDVRVHGNRVDDPEGCLEREACLGPGVQLAP